MSGDWPPYRGRVAVLADLERAIAVTPDALDTWFYYGSFLRDHGRLDDASAAFAHILARAPDHVETLVAAGAVLARRGRRLDARAAFERAVARDPRHSAALVNLANALALDEPARARSLYEAALAIDPGLAPAHRGLCGLAAAAGDRAAAARHRAGAFPTPFVSRPYYGASVPVPALALLSTDGGNVALDPLLDPQRFALTELYVEAYGGEALPPHAVLVNAIGDADLGADALVRAAAIAGERRAINAPAAVAATTRVGNAARLARLAGVVAPPVRPLPAAAPAAAAFPLIVRVPGWHMGRGMVRCDDPAAFERARATLPARDDLLVMRYLETRSPDGAWRKYRVMIVDGALYPLHLAIAEQWNVHYFSAPMAERPAWRAEEARFLADPARVLGPAAWAALAAVRDLLGLDYAGIDFALDAQRRVVVFEANAAMTVLAPDPDERFTYRRAAAEAIFAALARLMRSRGG